MANKNDIVNIDGVYYRVKYKCDHTEYVDGRFECEHKYFETHDMPNGISMTYVRCSIRNHPLDNFMCFQLEQLSSEELMEVSRCDS